MGSQDGHAASVTFSAITQHHPSTSCAAGGVSPRRLLALMRQKFEAAGGQVFEFRRLQGVPGHLAKSHSMPWGTLLQRMSHLRACVHVTVLKPLSW